jgi:hypothetical protein
VDVKRPRTGANAGKRVPRQLLDRYRDRRMHRLGQIAVEGRFQQHGPMLVDEAQNYGRART